MSLRGGLICSACSSSTSHAGCTVRTNPITGSGTSGNLEGCAPDHAEPRALGRLLVRADASRGWRPLLDLWYKNAVIYSLNVSTYKDGNGDGIGDFKGLAEQLDHIAQLGANCLWLLPFYPSPGLDHGYDVTDYYNVAPALGTLVSSNSVTKRGCGA